jgi:hypothetical protein
VRQVATFDPAYGVSEQLEALPGDDYLAGGEVRRTVCSSLAPTVASGGSGARAPAADRPPRRSSRTCSTFMSSLQAYRLAAARHTQQSIMVATPGVYLARPHAAAIRNCQSNDACCTTSS